ncbi:transposase [Methylobacterium sp. NEAU 140]|uniref:IS66-like element accessory protein TnpA n=1 Tax=Methylobacterium sp. NEAU 140 TaxID=3064945 RepID=UPI002735377C|nr:transposase [Methylobacterium sp. NEAU 140]MDP4026479.1 transposase [Methylobacterium sp. NEAU 140]
MLEDMVEPPRLVRRLEVITGAGGRRRWSEAERSRILVEATAPGAVVSAVARRHGMSPQHLFTWLREARRAASPDAAQPAPSFVPALVEEAEPGPAARPAQGRGRARRGPAAVIELEAAGVAVRIGAGASTAQIAAVIRALKAVR